MGKANTQAGTEATEEGGSAAAGFFSFSATSFEEQPDTPVADQAPKKRRVELPGESWMSGELPPWCTEGAAITLRTEQVMTADEMGVIMSISNNVATVRLILGNTRTGDGGAAGGGLGKERDVPISSLLPVAPTVGCQVKVVAGNHSGRHGTLIGFAGNNASVQMGPLNYETLPKSHVAMLASW